MKSIIIDRIELINFMGIDHKVLKFTPKINSIVGANATGKTTFNTAFRWLMFNKDVQDRKDFEIKTIDKNGKVKHGLEHTVIADLTIITRKLQLKKIYKEIWRKKKGAEKATFSGHETLYYIDDVPLLKKDYEKELEEIISEETFKVITDPLYFSEKLHWKDAREILLDITGEITDEEVYNRNTELKKLDLEGKTIEKYRKMVKEKKKLLNEELERIPVRIDEATKGIKVYNFDEINSELLECKREHEEIQEKLSKPIEEDQSRLDKKKKLAALKEQIFDLNDKKLQEFMKLKQDLIEKTRNLEVEATQSKMKAAAARKHAQDLQEENQSIEQKLIDLRREWNTENEKEFKSDIETSCPTCKREFTEEDLKLKLDKFLSNFNEQKAQTLDQINKKGRELSEKKQGNEVAISNFNDEINHYESEGDNYLEELKKLQLKVEELKPDQDEADEAGLIKELAKNLEEELQQEDSYSEGMKQRAILVDRKAQLDSEIEKLSRIMLYKELNDKTKDRIAELKQMQKDTANKIAQIEKQEYLADEFIRFKVEILEERINSKFKYVTFRLFEEQISGGLDEVCKPLINGVPFSDANRAAKINAGIDIINSITEREQIQAPIWIDNRESITELIDTDSQIINLFVDPNFAELKSISADNSIVKNANQVSLFD